MKLIYPEYVTGFKCIASRCQDNCCIGWEIDIDRETLGKYETLTLGDGKPIIEQTEVGNGAHFKLCQNKRCPFLNERNLCKIISCHGEAYVPEICREHPRYYSSFSDFREVGLGLCCEEACRIILTASLPISFVTQEDGSQVMGAEPSAAITVCRKYRNELFDMLNRKTKLGLDTALYILSSCDAVDDLCFGIDDDTPAASRESYCRADSVSAGLASFFGTLEGLEALSEDWSHAVFIAKKEASPLAADFMKRLSEKWDGHLRHLLFYFIHRYLLGGAEELTVGARARLAVYSAMAILFLLYLTGEDSPEGLCSTAKEYSKNVEYSTENIDALIDSLI